jgi:acetate kinase
VKAASWKTVIAAKAFGKASVVLDLAYLNQIRKQLDLSPLKNIASAHALMRLFELFELE